MIARGTITSVTDEYIGMRTDANTSPKIKNPAESDPPETLVPPLVAENK